MLYYGQLTNIQVRSCHTSTYFD